MKIDIQGRDFEITEALRHYIERRLSFSLNSWQAYIQRILVRLTDINGPRGGADKCCHIQLVTAQINDIVIEDIQANPYVAIDRASGRAGRTLSRRLSRRRDKYRARPIKDSELNKFLTEI